MNDAQILNWLYENGHKTPRQNTFRNNHIDSIAKEQRKQLDIIDIEPKQSLSNIAII